jgi:hypothetical protein
MPMIPKSITRSWHTHIKIHTINWHAKCLSFNAWRVASMDCGKDEFMSTNMKSADKIRLLDQMLEDIAGDEFDDDDTSEPAVNASHYAEAEELDIIDMTH